MASNSKETSPTATEEPQASESHEGFTKPQNEDARPDPLDLPDALEFEQTFKVYRGGTIKHDELGFDTDTLLRIYRNMLLQRRFEERSLQMYRKQNISGFLHLYIGQEAVSTGAMQSIDVGEDTVITAYRDHGMGLAMGMDPNACMAELFGKKDGCSKGKGGSMHFFSKEKRMFGGHGIVGQHIPVGTGIAFAHKYRGDGKVCLTFFGDGAVGQGAMHEAANLAGLYDLPIVFVIENNEYAMGTAVHRAFADPDLCKQAVPYGMPASIVDGMDVFSVTKAMRDHVAMARQNQPSFVEVRTYRYQGHSVSDPANYRTKGELDQKKGEDAIIRLKSYLVQHDLSTNEALDDIDDEVKQQVLDAIDFAENSPLPDLEAIYEDVYTQDDYPFLA
ncbi:MAG: pyruvate dehydrogenase (acetyl-transferring) E1 component subunit alpha [Bacteroidetes bacterium]|jgi:pyruvate dehydrogenase E1 component alpha subunit|nr:pyruvate dehydrogenase (acetyl-transferring) E1 component subunit alpha [Bacteroidota bacterium]